MSMKEIIKDNIDSFLEYYHNFHDSYISSINYDVYNEILELNIDVTWSGEAKLKSDNTYETNKTKLRLLFTEIEDVSIEKVYSYEYIDKVYLKSIKLDNNEYLCFADKENNPIIYVVSKRIEYEDKMLNEE